MIQKGKKNISLLQFILLQHNFLEEGYKESKSFFNISTHFSQQFFPNVRAKGCMISSHSLLSHVPSPFNQAFSGLT